MGTRTPWGTADSSESYGRGIVRYSTPSHGGFHVSPALNEQVPEYMRNAGGWYEEDCEWSVVGVVFAYRFMQAQQAAALETLRHWLPDAYERYTGKAILPGESYKRDEETFLREHAGDWIAIAAVGDWHKDVPSGMVGVTATQGGKRDGVEWYFVVPRAEYENRQRFFVVPGGATRTEPL